MKYEEQFKKFWALYPKRNGKKTGRDFCEVWFEAKKPDDDTFDKIMRFIKLDVNNREVCEKQGKFYAAPKDPKVFLKAKPWRDEIEELAKPKDKYSTDCCECGGDGYATHKHKWYCVKCIKQARGY
jgi:hypothetical protein